MASPAFQFYAKDWLVDTRELGAYGRGVLIDMIALCWENGSIADDAATVAAAVGADDKQVLKLWPKLRAKFGTDANHPDRLFNMRLEVEREKQAEYSAQQSAKGKLSAEARARAKVQQRFNRGSSNGSTAAETTVQPQYQPEPQPNVNPESTLRSASSVGSKEPTPPTPLQGATAAQPRLFGEAAPRDRRKERREAKESARNQHLTDARRVLDALNAARLRTVANARVLKPTPENLALIADRLAGGNSVDDCLHVIAVREAEAAISAEAETWFTAITPFRPEPFAHALAQPAPDKPVEHTWTAEEIAAAEEQDRQRALAEIAKRGGVADA